MLIKYIFNDINAFLTEYNKIEGIDNMNVYDFDKTIYDGDSTLDFYLFALRKRPTLIKYLPIQVFGFLKYLFGLSTKLEFKEKFYCFLNVKDKCVCLLCGNIVAVPKKYHVEDYSHLF